MACKKHGFTQASGRSVSRLLMFFAFQPREFLFATGDAQAVSRVRFAKNKIGPFGFPQFKPGYHAEKNTMDTACARRPFMCSLGIPAFHTLSTHNNTTLSEGKLNRSISPACENAFLVLCVLSACRDLSGNLI